MTTVKALIVGCAGAFAFLASAHAADPGGTWRRPVPEPEYEKPAPQYRELLSGWYLRGDLGYRFNSVGSLTSDIPATSLDYANAVGFGAGFGYKYEWFRADVTLDRGGPAKITASTAAPVVQPQYSAKVNALTLLVNAYIDLGTWAGFTPYVGAGAGVSSMVSKNYLDTAGSIGPITGPAKQENFAWAWMVGVAFQVQPKWVVDVGFRQLRLGNMDGAETAQLTNNAAIFRDLTANEIRIGLRYLFD